MRGKSGGGRHGFARGRQHGERRPVLSVAVGERAGRRHRQIGHAGDARNLRHFDFGGVKKEKTLCARHRRHRIAGGIRVHRQMRLDLDAVQARLHAAQRQRHRIGLEGFAGRFGELEIHGVAAVDADDDLRLARQPGRIAARHVEIRLGVIGGIKIRR